MSLELLESLNGFLKLKGHDRWCFIVYYLGIMMQQNLIHRISYATSGGVEFFMAFIG